MRPGAALATALLVALVAAPQSTAAVEVGQISPADPTTGCAGGGYNMVQAVTGSAPSYQVPPGGGVITAWRHRGDDATPGSGRLLVWTPAGGDLYTLIGHSAPVAFTAGVVNEFATRIEVGGGVLLGLRTVDSFGCGFGNAPDQARFEAPATAPEPGETHNLLSPGNTRLNVAVTLEPDVDGDGFGDETQDCFPGDASLTGPCALADPPGADLAPPETTITKRPAAKTKKKSASFEFASSEPGSSFRCSVDGRAFEPCTSPLTVKAGRGSHTFQVRATDASGNTDPTEATATWKVRKPRRG